MNAAEFDQWIKMHRAAFPEVQQWFADNEDPKAALALWREALAPVELEAAQKVTRRMLAGELEHPDRWNCSKLPGAIISAVTKRLPTIGELNERWNPHTGMGGQR